MGKRKLLIGVIVGAVVGGLITLFDRGARTYTKSKLRTVKSNSSYVLKNPSEAVHQLQSAFDTFSGKFTNGAESAINILDQVQNTLGKVENKKETIEIE